MVTWSLQHEPGMGASTLPTICHPCEMSIKIPQKSVGFMNDFPQLLPVTHQLYSMFMLFFFAHAHWTFPVRLSLEFSVYVIIYLYIIYII